MGKPSRAKGRTACNEIANEGDALARQVNDCVAARMTAPEIKDLHDARTARDPKRLREGQVREDEIEASKLGAQRTFVEIPPIAVETRAA